MTPEEKEGLSEQGKALEKILKELLIMSFFDYRIQMSIENEAVIYRKNGAYMIVIDEFGDAMVSNLGIRKFYDCDKLDLEEIVEIFTSDNPPKTLENKGGN